MEQEIMPARLPDTLTEFSFFGQTAGLALQAEPDSRGSAGLTNLPHTCSVCDIFPD